MKDIIDEIAEALEASGAYVHEGRVAQKIEPGTATLSGHNVLMALSTVVAKRMTARAQEKADLASMIPMTADQWDVAMRGEWVPISDSNGIVRGRVRESGFRIQFEASAPEHRAWIHAYAEKTVTTDGASLNLVGVFEAF